MAHAADVKSVQMKELDHGDNGHGAVKYNPAVNNDDAHVTVKVWIVVTIVSTNMPFRYGKSH